GQPLYESMLAFYRRHYVPGNMKLVIFSKRPPQALQALAEAQFQSIPRKEYQRPELDIRGLTDAELGQHIYYQPQKPMRRLNLEFAIDDNTDQWRVKPN